MSSRSPPDSSTHFHHTDLYINLLWEEKNIFGIPPEHNTVLISDGFCERRYLLCAQLSVASGVFCLTAENQFHLLIAFLPAFLLYMSQGSPSVTSIHHLCVTSLSLTLHRPITRITLLTFRIYSTRIASMRLSNGIAIISYFPRVIVQLVCRLPPGSKRQGNSGRWRESVTKDSGDREKKPRRRTGSVPVIAVIWQGDIYGTEKLPFSGCISVTRTNPEITVSPAGL